MTCIILISGNMHIHVHVYIYICIHMHTYTHTYTYIGRFKGPCLLEQMHCPFDRQILDHRTTSLRFSNGQEQETSHDLKDCLY